MVKVDGEPSEEYWLSLLKKWLDSLQSSYDLALEKGIINNSTGEIDKKKGKLTEEVCELLNCVLKKYTEA